MNSFPLAPPQASEFAHRYDILFYTITALTAFFSVLVIGGTLFLVIRYRRGTKVNRDHPPHEGLPLEITWSVIPLVLGLFIFVWGAHLFVYFKEPPKNASNVYVVGKQWMWHFQHADTGIRENNELHLPVNVPVKFTMISQDVIHALYIPAFRFQYQVVPGLYTEAWCTPDKVGTYHLFCNMYCGTQHSEMGGYVYVMTKHDYEKWSENGGNDPQPMTEQQRGKLVFERLNCSSCHAVQSNERAPSLYGLYGRIEHYTDGSTFKVNTARIRNSILNPYDHVVAGYGNTMPEYEGAISEQDMFPLIAYLKSLGEQSTAKVQNGKAMGPANSTPIPVQNKPSLKVGALKYATPPKPYPRRGNLAVGALGYTENQPGQKNGK